MNPQEIQNLIKEIIESMGLGFKEIVVSAEDGSKTTWFSVVVDNPYHFTSREGEALQALNHIVRRIVESKMGQNLEAEPPLGGSASKFEGPAILVDIGDFQKKRVENVKVIAHMMAERARYFKSSIEVDPMSAFDRRIVHEFISNATDLKTESMGYGSSRRVVIKYIGTI